MIFQTDRVRVLGYRDSPGERTTPHAHPDSVMYTLSSCRRRLVSSDVRPVVELVEGTLGWLPAEEHYGQNVGDTRTHVLFVELKRRAADDHGRDEPAAVGPR